jgi:hypothetical protein
MNSHLTHEQLSDLLLAETPSDIETFSEDQLDLSREHIAHCAICAGELAELRRSLTLFRSTADAWANHAWERQVAAQRITFPPVALRQRSTVVTFFQKPAVWATAAAAALLLAAALPLNHRTARTDDKNVPSAAVRQTPMTHASQSDEALLLEINQTLSSSVPTPMQPLADPADESTQANNDVRNN